MKNLSKVELPSFANSLFTMVNVTSVKVTSLQDLNCTERNAHKVYVFFFLLDVYELRLDFIFFTIGALFFFFSNFQNDCKIKSNCIVYWCPLWHSLTS